MVNEVWKVFFCGLVALLAAFFTYDKIKNIMPIPFVISLLVFILVYAGMTHMVKY